MDDPDSLRIIANDLFVQTASKLSSHVTISTAKLVRMVPDPASGPESVCGSFFAGWWYTPGTLGVPTY
jgi:hypothetical protein